MRVRVDPERCLGHGMCNAFAGELFAVTEEGFNEMGEFAVPEGLEGVARRGIRACPERAIEALNTD